MRIWSNHYGRMACIACMCAAMVLFVSCFHDNMEECMIKINFDYSYNIKQTNAFGKEISKVKVWAFDSDKMLVAQYQDEGEDLQANHQISISGLEQGEYTLVAWAYEASDQGKPAGLVFPKLVPGESTMDELTMLLNKEYGTHVFDEELDALLCGVYELNFENTSEESLTIHMIKCTNKIKVILMPYKAGQQVDVDDYDFLITDKNANLDYKGDMHQESPVNYKPYYSETIRNIDPEDGGDINQVGVAEFAVSRLFYGNKPTLRIADNQGGAALLDINLTWLLSLQAIGEHKDQWGNQEYLDRQDHYALTFFMDEGAFMKNQIIVNGWTVSAGDIGLR